MKRIIETRRVGAELLAGAVVGVDYDPMLAKVVAWAPTRAEAASRLNHPNTVHVFDFGRTKSGSLYLVMEYVDATDFRLFDSPNWLTFLTGVSSIPQAASADVRAGSPPLIHACGVPSHGRVLRLHHFAVRVSLQQRYDRPQNTYELVADDMGKAARWLLQRRQMKSMIR